LDPAAFGVASGEDFIPSEDSLDLAKRFAEAVSGSAASSQVALTKFHYFVEAQPGTVEYTFRGIKRLLEGDRLAAEEAAKKGAPIEELKRTLPNRVGFAFGKSDLTAEGMNQLDVWGEVLLDERDYHVTLIGHTDDIGSERYNLNLSRRRAQRAHDYIVEKFGVDRSRLQVRWRGESEPLVSNRDDESRAENRRVDFVLMRK
jgi:outer membrane protein OmpA-like peptidoglycan-associated protein